MGGFDEGRLSAQARLTQKRVTSFGNDAFFSLGIAASVRSLDRWADCTEPKRAVDVLLDGLFKGLSTARVAATALSKAPPTLVIRPHETVVGQLTGHREHQYWAAMALAAAQDAKPLPRWATDDTVTFRLIAAQYLAAQDDDGTLNSAMTKLAFDTDREVAQAAIRTILRVKESGEVHEELEPFLQQVVGAARSDWQCGACGTLNLASASSCTNCHVVAPDPIGTAAAALADLATR